MKKETIRQNKHKAYELRKEASKEKNWRIRFTLIEVIRDFIKAFKGIKRQ